MHAHMQGNQVVTALQLLGDAASDDDVSDEDLDAAVAAAMTVPGVGEELLRRASLLAQADADAAETESA